MMTQNVFSNADNLYQKPKVSAWRQIIFVVFVGSLIAILILGAFLFYNELQYENRIFSGISVGTIDLSELTLNQAFVKLNSELNYPEQGKILFTDGDSKWLYTPANLGFSFNPAEVAKQAYSIGRDKGLLTDLATQYEISQKGLVLSPTVVYDQRYAYGVLQAIAAEINQPLIESAMRLDGTEVILISGQTGRALDIDATLKRLDAYFLTQQDGIIPLSIIEEYPKIMNAQAVANQAIMILSEPLTINAPDAESGGPWAIEPADLAGLLVIERIDSGEKADYQLTLNRPLLINYLKSLAPALTVEPVNARMFFNQERGELEVTQNAIIGKTLDIEASADHIINSLQGGEHQTTLIIKDELPLVTDNSTAAELGITGILTESTSYFYGSDPARIQNIRAASTSFDGVLIAPGEVFSMAKYLTDISLDNGYAEAIIIVGDQSVKGVGGGVCQVSTTLFRTAFFAGFPIVERHAHAYRVGYYEQQSNGWADSNLAGLDATVYVPLVDLKFRNDTPYWILMETFMSNYSLTWRFYSTSDGRSVDWWTTGITNVVPAPKAVYIEDPELAEGEIEQVDWAVNGASVSVYRTVFKSDGSIHLEDSVHTTYIAWPDKYHYGPGTEVPD